MKIVMDSSAVIAYLRQETGWEIVGELLLSHDCCIHAINLCEIYYQFRRCSGDGTARNAITDIESLGIKERNDMNREFWLKAGAIKGDLKRLSLADCMCIALAQELGASVVTTDRHEMEPIRASGICPIIFIR